MFFIYLIFGYYNPKETHNLGYYNYNPQKTAPNLIFARVPSSVKADGPPAFGVVESTPRSGYAVSSLFTLNLGRTFEPREPNTS